MSLPSLRGRPSVWRKNNYYFNKTIAAKERAGGAAAAAAGGEGRVASGEPSIYPCGLFARLPFGP